MSPTLLRDRRFVALLAGQGLSAIGSFAAIVATWGYVTYRYDQGAGGVALIGLAFAVPGVLVAPLAGLPIDRVGPRRVLVAADAFAAVVSVAVIFTSSFGQIVALSVLHGIAKGFAEPAIDALPPRVVDERDLLRANAYLGAARMSAIVVGPVVAATAIPLFGLAGAFVVDAATYVVGIAALLVLRPRPAARERDARLLDELLAGARVSLRTPMLRYTHALALVATFTWGTFFVLEPIYVRDVLGRGPATLGLLQTAFGVGLVGTSAVLPRLGSWTTTARCLAASVALSGAAAGLYVGTAWLPVAFLGVALWGVDVAVFLAPARTLLQSWSPPGTVGRVMAVHATLRSCADLVALPLAAALSGVLGVQMVGLGAGAAALAFGVLGLRFGARLDRAPAGAATEPDVAASAVRTISAGSSTGADPLTGADPSTSDDRARVPRAPRTVEAPALAASSTAA